MNLNLYSSGYTLRIILEIILVLFHLYYWYILYIDWSEEWNKEEYLTDAYVILILKLISKRQNLMKISGMFLIKKLEKFKKN